MVASLDAHTMSGECGFWREQLHSFRSRMYNHQRLLRTSPSQECDKDEILQIEHLNNQLHIQLINVHDLKQEVKRHMQIIGFEYNNLGRVTDNTIARHERLQEQYKILTNTLQQVFEEFETFISGVVL